MPVTKSAKKSMRQSLARRDRRAPFKNKLKTIMKSALNMAKDGNAEELKKYMPHAFSVIDTASKKKIIEKNNAARKKSRLARLVKVMESPAGIAEKAAKEAKATKLAKTRKTAKTAKAADKA